MAWVTKNSTEEYTPEEPQREYTKKEKAGNWWHYNRGILLCVAFAVLLVAWFIYDIVTQVEPDYQIGYVGTAQLPSAASEGLVAALEAYGEDLNGDGRVVVQVNEYLIDFESGDTADVYNQMAGVTKLGADLSANSGAYIFLVQDPAGFQRQSEALMYLDGTLTDLEETHDDWQNMVYRWQDCPVLAGLDLGVYEAMDAQGNIAEIDNQTFFENLYVGRRGVWVGDVEEKFPGGTAMWQTLTEGAARMEETP